MSINDILDMDLSPLLFIIVAVAVVSWLVVKYRIKRVDAENDTYYVTGIHVRVVDKPKPLSAAGWIGVTPVVFEQDNGERMQYNVPSNQSYSYVVGDVGMLYVQGTRVVRFERGAPANPPQRRNATGGSENPQNMPTWKRIQMEKEKKQ